MCLLCEGCCRLAAKERLDFGGVTFEGDKRTKNSDRARCGVLQLREGEDSLVRLGLQRLETLSYVARIDSLLL